MLRVPAHKPIRLAVRNYLGQNHYFVTICCFQRHRAFLDAKFAAWILNLLRSESAVNSFSVHAYCLMPDHFHFLAEGMEPSSDLRYFMKSLKIKSSRRYSEQTGRVLWQKSFYEHILRGSERCEDVAWYIWLNPVRKRLVTRPKDYPLLGSFAGKVMPEKWSEPRWCPPWKTSRALTSNRV